MKTAQLPHVNWAELYGKLAEAVDFHGLAIKNEGGYMRLIPKDCVVGHVAGNAREQLESAFEWLGWMDEDISYQLRSPEDAIKLWRYWTNNMDLPEFIDRIEEDDDGNVIDLRQHVKAAIGYVPPAIDEHFAIYCEE